MGNVTPKQVSILTILIRPTSLYALRYAMVYVCLCHEHQATKSSKINEKFG